MHLHSLWRKMQGWSWLVGEQGLQTDAKRNNDDEVTILQHRDSPVCDVIVVFRGREMILRLPNYKHALKWARMECKAYQLPEQFFAQAANQSAEQ